MPLYVKDPEVGELAEKLAALTQTTKTEAVRRALRDALTHARTTSAPERGKPSYVERGLRFSRDILNDYPPGAHPQPVTKEWIDSLYEDG
ncbi:type II toxin-antitoxin system VapB family antitoxin [Aurantimonas coralicida]|uniref:type II toxin-antitoxin system VapB family antitoxin n=1 Tax=Aurantimonas coralicida TaxID=182270 RepID=UPI001D1844E8|nr:type II toxin-antitoxin system VapB family antitoxin [Aurantimonas coralicida]MCC4296438.1 type II toxin-antitoxin system VapB family antitoxin [Aurantimonas coralicida]